MDLKNNEFVKQLKKEFYVNLHLEGVGKVEFLPDKTICYVRESALKRRGDYPYQIELKGLLNKEACSYYGISDNVVYIVDGVDFSKEVYFDCSNATLVVRNCTFNDKVIGNFIHDGKAIFENNDYSSCRYINCYRAEEITFVDAVASNLDYVNLDAKKITLCNSKFSSNDTVRIDALSLLVEDTEIDGKEVTIKSDNVEGYDSIMEASGCLDMNGKGFYNKPFDCIVAPTIVYNGEEIDSNFEVLDDKMTEVDNKRVLRSQLIGELKEVYTNCVDEMNKKTVGKVLRKKI